VIDVSSNVALDEEDKMTIKAEVEAAKARHSRARSETEITDKKME